MSGRSVLELTLSQVVPVGGGEKGVAAQALVAQPLPSSAQEALHQVHHDPAGAHLLWELQVPLRVKTEAEVVKETAYRKRDARSRPLFCCDTVVKSPRSRVGPLWNVCVITRVIVRLLLTQSSRRYNDSFIMRVFMNDLP